MAVAVLLLLCPAPAVALEAGRLLPDHEGFSFWEQGPFRIKFARQGEHAAPDRDSSGNGCPDFVEDVAKQLNMAHYIFCDLFGFPSPLESPRYPGVRYFNVGIYNRERLQGYRGLNFDRPANAVDTAAFSVQEPGRPLPRSRVLNMMISRDIDPAGNMTPAHEYFHHIQNGATYFKPNWFYEGLAAWSYDALGVWRPVSKAVAASAGNPLDLLADPERLEELLASSYGAADTLWMPLARLCPGASQPLPEEDPFLDLVYSDGSSVLKDREIAGMRMMREILAGFAAAEEEAFSLYQYGEWSSAARRDPRNNHHMVEVILKTAAAVCLGAE